MRARVLTKSEYIRWDEFVMRHELGTIHQLSVWGEFQSGVAGRGPFWIVVLENGERIVGGCLVVRHALPRGMCWLYGSRGPLLDYTDVDCEAQMGVLTDEIRKIAQREKAVFWRIDPAVRVGEKGGGDNEFQKKFSELGFRAIKEGFQPQHSLAVDLRGSEEEILAQMKQKGRYNIRLAEKKGVKILRSSEADLAANVSEFYRLLTETTERDGFSGHKEGYYLRMLEVLGDKADLYLAEWEGKVIAGAIVTYFGDVATYYYGVSSNEFRSVMAPYSLHWEAMKEAKGRGFEWYDLFGIAPAGEEKGHSWEGVTEFKRKFGGQDLSYVQPMEMAFRRVIYQLYRGYKKMKGK